MEDEFGFTNIEQSPPTSVPKENKRRARVIDTSSLDNSDEYKEDKEDKEEEPTDVKEEPIIHEELESSDGNLIDDTAVEKKGLFGRIKLFGSKKDTTLPESPVGSPTVGSPVPDKHANSEAEYAKYLDQAKDIDFTEEKKMGFLYKSGIDTMGRPVLVFVASFLPGKKTDSDRLLLYIINEMDSIVIRDYTLVYVHSNFSSQNRPAFAWLRKAYRVLNRKYKKNLKSLFIIHPTFWIKTTSKLFKPLISNKFWQKLTYINDVNDLYKFIHRDQITLPSIVFQYGTDKAKLEPIFGASLADVLERPDHSNSEVPIVVEKSVKYLIEKKANTIQGIFRLSGSNLLIQQLRKDFDKGEVPDFEAIEDLHVIAGLLKLYFRELPEPLFPFDFYDRLIQSYINNKDKIVPTLAEVLRDLPAPNRNLLRYLLELLAYVEKNADTNKMTSSNLSIVFAPNLIRSPKESIQQAVMHAPIINSIMRAIIENHEALIPALKAQD